VDHFGPLYRESDQIDLLFIDMGQCGKFGTFDLEGICQGTAQHKDVTKKDQLVGQIMALVWSVEGRGELGLTSRQKR